MLLQQEQPLTNITRVTIKTNFASSDLKRRKQPRPQGFSLKKWVGRCHSVFPIPISLAFWASPVGDAQNADHFDFA